MPRGYGLKRLPKNALDKQLRLEQFLRAGPTITVQPGPTLDQDGPKCTGFSAGTWYNATPIAHAVGAAWCDQFYVDEKVIDGDNEDGSTELTLATVLKNRGIVPNFAFSQDADVGAQYVDTTGPVLYGIPWYRSMEEPDPDTGIITLDKATGLAGGHSIAKIANIVIVGEAYDVWQNTWGEWGVGFRGIATGFCLIKRADAQRLLNDVAFPGVILAALETGVEPTPTPAPAPAPSGCLSLIKSLGRR